MKKLHSVLGLIALSTALAACGGQAATEDDGTQINDAKTSEALSSPQPASPSGGTDATGEAGDDDQERADKDDDHDRGDDHEQCNEDEVGEHHHHRHHRFHVLDGLDGTRDHQITIASLPASLPARLIARLHEIDTNGDGIVTKDEAKAWEHAHKHDRGMKKH